MMRSLRYSSLGLKFLPGTQNQLLNNFVHHRCLAIAVPPINHYRVLGLTPKATQNEIKDAYYNLTKLFHPDVNDDKSVDAVEKFRQITSAYEVLGIR